MEAGQAVMSGRFFCIFEGELPLPTFDADSLICIG